MKDKFLLISTSIMVAFVLFSSIFILNKWFAKEWANFIVLLAAYWVMLNFAAYKLAVNERLNIVKVLMPQFIYFVLTAGIAYILIIRGIISAPFKYTPYMIVIILLTYGSLAYLMLCTYKWKGYFKAKRGSIGSALDSD